MTIPPPHALARDLRASPRSFSTIQWEPSEIFHLTLSYGTDDRLENIARTSSFSRSSSSSSSSLSSSASTSSIISQDRELRFRIELDWSASEDKDQVALKLQSQLMETVVVELSPRDDHENVVDLGMKVVKRREPLRSLEMPSLPLCLCGCGLSVNVAYSLMELTLLWFIPAAKTSEFCESAGCLYDMCSFRNWKC
ncbi:hypothetical protein V8G54_022364 [Vigna mungo]|uniref:Uncharacterized protein n=1 Tax=Vigna mungo TaxID=3915 RepID=A0AAQ3RXT1_VIGMU